MNGRRSKMLRKFLGRVFPGITNAAIRAFRRRRIQQPLITSEERLIAAEVARREKRERKRGANMAVVDTVAMVEKLRGA